MTAQLLVTRRMLLRDMGRAGLAVMVMGTAACSSDPTENATPTDKADPTATTTTTAAATTTSQAATTTTGFTEGGHDWHRVNLDFVSAYILYRGGEAVIVDTGVDGSATSIGSALDEIDLAWGDVSGLIVTHRHPDHQGSVRGVLAETAAETPWYAGAGDIGEITAPYGGTSVGDGDSVNDLQIIETPGHTPGHIAVLDPISGILVSGDALNGENGGVVGANPAFSEDMDVANASVIKLAGFDYEVALFGHGEPLIGDATAAVGELAASLG